MDEASGKALALVEELTRGLVGSQMEGVETQGVAVFRLEGAWLGADKSEGWMGQIDDVEEGGQAVDGAVEIGQPGERPPLRCGGVGAGVEVVEVTHEKERRLLSSFSASELETQSKLLMVE